MYYLTLRLLFVALLAFKCILKGSCFTSLYKESNVESLIFIFLLILLLNEAYHVYMKMLLIMGLRSITIAYILLGSQTWKQKL